MAAASALLRSERTSVEFATFSNRDGVVIPEMWHITNVHGLDPQTGEYLPPTKEFRASEQILGNHLSTFAPAEVRAHLSQLAAGHSPFWFHQGINLVVFNTLEEGVKAAFRRLHQAGRLPQPQTLQDWERHARMRVLIYGAYFEAFGQAGERYVGRGADVLSIPWPDR